MSSFLDIRWSHKGSGLELLEIRTGDALASLSIFGGQLLTWQPRHADAPVLWLSENAQYDMRKAIRGGVPICWPWFGAHPTSASLPAHGLARLGNWLLNGASLLEDGDAKLVMSLPPTGGPDGHNLRLCQTIRIGKQLSVSLSTQNIGDTPASYSEGLHTYFQIGDIDQVSIEGLDGCSYADLTAANVRCMQQGDISFNGETARLFVGNGQPCNILDRGLGRRIRVEKAGSQSTAIWNPSADVASRMPDLGPTSWRRMVCVETANALDDCIVIAPGESRTMTAKYSVEPLV